MENLEILKNKKIILSVDPILKEYENIMLEKTKKYFKDVEFILGSEPEINSYYYKKLRKLKEIKILGKFIEKIYNKKIKNYYNKLLEKYLEKDYVLVIGEIGYSQEFIKLVKKKNKKIRFLKFIWDKMEQKKIEEYKENYNVVYTFEKDDAIRYNLKWRPSFFLEQGNLKKNIDFYYLGRERDKERYIYVKKIFKYCIKNKLNYKILLYSQDKKKKEEFITNKKIKYSENIENKQITLKNTNILLANSVFTVYLKSKKQIIISGISTIFVVLMSQAIIMYDDNGAIITKDADKSNAIFFTENLSWFFIGK